MGHPNKPRTPFLFWLCCVERKKGVENISFSNDYENCVLFFLLQKKFTFWRTATHNYIERKVNFSQEFSVFQGFFFRSTISLLSTSMKGCCVAMMLLLLMTTMVVVNRAVVMVDEFASESHRSIFVFILGLLIHVFLYSVSSSLHIAAASIQVSSIYPRKQATPIECRKNPRSKKTN